jgi:uncharacterized SAM-binding protein YcdF (DUF218 family)
MAEAHDRCAVVVPGNGMVAADGSYRISESCIGLVRAAERLVEELSVDAVAFSGWSPVGGASEAEQMRDVWRGRDVALVVEPTATTTAQNASRTLPLLLERGVRRAVVVCAPLHVPRARFFFSRVYGAAGVEVAFRKAPVAASARALAWEVLALSVARAQLRAARAEHGARR